MPSKDKGRKQQWKVTSKLRAKRQARRNYFENCTKKFGAEEFLALRQGSGST